MSQWLLLQSFSIVLLLLSFFLHTYFLCLFFPSFLFSHTLAERREPENETN